MCTQKEGQVVWPFPGREMVSCEWTAWQKLCSSYQCGSDCSGKEQTETALNQQLLYGAWAIHLRWIKLQGGLKRGSEPSLHLILMPTWVSTFCQMIIVFLFFFHARPVMLCVSACLTSLTSSSWVRTPTSCFKTFKNAHLSFRDVALLKWGSGVKMSMLDTDAV